MTLKFLLISILINLTQCKQHLQTAEVLNTKLRQATDFIEVLRSEYASQVPNENNLSEINNKVSEYVKNVTEPLNSRKKREVTTSMVADKGINVLDGFTKFLKFNLSNIQDTALFSFQNEAELTWFAVILKTTEISLFQLSVRIVWAFLSFKRNESLIGSNMGVLFIHEKVFEGLEERCGNNNELNLFQNNTFHQITTYPQINGKQVVVDSYIHSVLLIVQTENDTVIFRFAKIKDKYILNRIQELEFYNVTDLKTWHGMNQLYLGIASSTNILIFTWFGEYFDMAQIINFGSEKLIPFYNKESMHLAAIGSTTMILRFSLRFNEFILIQKLPPSEDASTFHFKEEHFAEHFLSLSTNSHVVLYKEIHDRFVPFQKVSAGTSVVSVIRKKAILLLILHENSVITYQYDGWRFIRLNAKLFGVRQMRLINLFDEEMLLVEYEDNTWALEQFIWVQTKSWRDLQDEIKAWCIEAKKKAQRMPKEIPELKQPIRILNGHIGQLNALNVSRLNSTIITDVSRRYKEVESKFEEQNMEINSKEKINTLIVPFLNVKKGRVQCKSECRASHLNIKENINPLVKLRMAENTSKVKKAKENWLCPRIAIPMKKVTVDKSINDISLNDLQKNLLKTTGNQEVLGEYSFFTMNTTNALLPLNIVSHSTRQEVMASEIKVKELNLTNGGFLLPLNGSSTTITGSLKARRVKLKGNVTLHGRLTGNTVKHASPVMLISENVKQFGDYILQNVKIENLLNVNDIIFDNGKSIRDVISNGISLNDNVSVPLLLSSEKTKWNNVTLNDQRNWVTVNSKNTIISGMKHIPFGVLVTKDTYDYLKLPKIDVPICGRKVIAPGIKMSVATIDNITAKKLIGLDVSGNAGQELLKKQLYRRVFAKNILVREVNDTDLNALKRYANSWTEPNIFRGSIEVSDLKTEVLKTPTQFSIQLPQHIRNMVSKGNTYVGNINGIDLIEFLNNIVKLEDMISLGNITFKNSFSTDHLHASHLPMNLTKTSETSILQSIQISGNLKADKINLPHSFKYNTNQTPSDVVIRGSATFLLEPTIQIVNEIILKNLSNEIWMINDTVSFHGRNLHFKTASMKNNVTVKNPLNALNFGSWKEIKDRLFSKTKDQEIQVSASFDNIVAPAIIGGNFSTIKSSVSSLNDLLSNALLKDGQQEVKAKWHLDKLTVLGKSYVGGKVNNLNLKTDVVRHDAAKNIVTGKKSVAELATKNLYGLHFDEWADRALIQNGKKLIIIKGRKKFNTVAFNDLNISGTIMGHKIDEALLKSKNQRISGRKTIQGSVHAPEFIIDGLINDVNLTELINYQLKKVQPSQRIKTAIELQNDLRIIGNLTVDGLYQGVELKNFDQNSSKLSPLAQKVMELTDAAAAIDMALQNHAIYVNKFEIVKEESVDVSNTEICLNNSSECKTRNTSFTCDNATLVHDISPLNSTNFIEIKSMLLDNNFLAVAIESNTVSIHLHNDEKKEFTLLTDLYVPDIVDAIVEPLSTSLWIILKLSSQTLVLHYEPWDNFQKYILPATEVFTVSRTPNNQLLLILSDGIWNLEGLASPRNILKVPFKGKVEPFTHGFDCYVRSTWNNDTTLMKARYVGN